MIKKAELANSILDLVQHVDSKFMQTQDVAYNQAQAKEIVHGLAMVIGKLTALVNIQTFANEGPGAAAEFTKHIATTVHDEILGQTKELLDRAMQMQKKDRLDN